jgi:hypothetical protein
LLQRPPDNDTMTALQKLRFGNSEVSLRRGVEFKAGSKTLAVGDHMHVHYLMGNSNDVAIFKEDGTLIAKRLWPKMVFADHTNQCSIENCFVDIPAEEQKQLLAVYNKFSF